MSESAIDCVDSWHLSRFDALQTLLLASQVSPGLTSVLLDGVACSRSTPADQIPEVFKVSNADLVLPELVVLDLATNGIQEMSPLAAMMPALRELGIVDNQITTISASVLDGLNNLCILNLTGNPLIAIDIPSTLSSLEMLRLSSTMLQSFPLDIFSLANNGLAIQMDDMQALQCAASMCPVKNGILGIAIDSSGQFCQLPSGSWTDWSSLTSSDLGGCLCKYASLNNFNSDFLVDTTPMLVILSCSLLAMVTYSVFHERKAFERLFCGIHCRGQFLCSRI